MSNEQNPPVSNRGVRKFHPSIKTLYSNIDWLTATTRSDQVGMEWLEAYHKHHKDTMPLGKSLKAETKNLMGFDCLKFNGLTWGYNPSSKWYMVIATGITAGNTWHTFLPKATNVSRLDIAVTVLLNDTVEDLAELYYTKLLPEHEKARAYSIIINKKGGQTLYVGSRSSQQFGRVYDKGIQSGEYKAGNLWRYEIELKKPMSFPVAMALYDRWVKQGTSVAESFIAYNHQWFMRRGIEPLFSPDETFSDVRLETVVSTVESKLSWYRRSVRPSVQDLIGAGYLREVVGALGLDDYVQNEFFSTLDEDTPEDQI